MEHHETILATQTELLMALIVSDELCPLEDMNIVSRAKADLGQLGYEVDTLNRVIDPNHTSEISTEYAEKLRSQLHNP